MGDIIEIGIRDFEHSPNEVDYLDEDIVFINDVREIPELDIMKVNANVIAVCSRGRVQVDVNGKTVTLYPNDIILCPSKCIVNNYMLSPDYECKVLCLSDKIIKESLGTNIEIWNRAVYINKQNIIHIDEDGMNLTDSYYNLVQRRLLLKGTPYHQEIMHSLLSTILLELCGMIKANMDESVKLNTGRQNELFRRFLDNVLQSKTKKQTVDYYAEQLFVTPKYLSAVCKKVSGKTASEWIHEYVMTDINYYLKNTDKSIKEIADILGFPNISFFGKYVRIHFGMSPKEYRKTMG